MAAKFSMSVKETCFICDVLVDGIKRPVITIRNEQGDTLFLCEDCHRHVCFHHYIPEGRSTFDYIKHDVIWGTKKL